MGKTRFSGSALYAKGLGIIDADGNEVTMISDEGTIGVPIAVAGVETGNPSTGEQAPTHYLLIKAGDTEYAVALYPKPE